MPNNTLKLRYNAQKRRLFDIYYSKLNDMQRECVYTVNGPLMILAGAGSGKTTVLVNRLYHTVRYGDAVKCDSVPEGVGESDIAEMERAASLTREELGRFLERFAVNVPPAWSVLAVTFTNKAANEIKERVRAAFGEDSEEADDMWTGTFHSVCMRILRSYGELLGYGKGFGVADSDDSKKIITECMKSLNIDTKSLPVKSVAAEISSAKNRLMTPSGYAEEAGRDVRMKKTAAVYEMYQGRLKSSNLLDFDDIIMQTVFLLRDFEEVRTKLQNRFRYVSIDEYQDTNHAQFMLVSLLAGHRKNLMVVGDDDQSIYKFRGATIENILTFDKTYPDAAVIRLEQNYRSTKTILDAANAVIARNKERKGKNLWTDREKGEEITLKKLQTQLDEARYICDTVAAMHEDGESFRDFAVLYRTNAMSRAIEQAMAKSGIPYRMIGAMRFFERAEIKDILAYASVINNPADSVRLRRIINVPRRGIGEKSIQAASDIADALGLPLLEVMRTAQSYAAIPPAAQRAMTALAQLFTELRSDAENMKISSLIENISVKTGYQAMLTAAGEAEKDRLENIGELVSTAAQYEESAAMPSLSEFLEDVALVSDIDRYDETADAVVLMTIHSAKGLEFPVVFLPGWEEGIFPGFQSIMKPEEIEEERRLAYVALTRAKRLLFITHVHQRMLNGSTQYNQISRFAREIPQWLKNEEEDAYDYSGRSAFSGMGGGSGYGFGKQMPARAGGTPIYNRGAPGSGWGTGEERAAYTGNVPGASYNSYNSYNSNNRSAAPKRFSAPSVPGASRPEARRSAPLESFDKGDRVRHTTFGSGTVLSVRAMGGDVLYEIEFDKVGTKKLMASFARLKKD